MSDMQETPEVEEPVEETEVEETPVESSGGKLPDFVRPTKATGKTPRASTGKSQSVYSEAASKAVAGAGPSSTHVRFTGIVGNSNLADPDAGAFEAKFLTKAGKEYPFDTVKAMFPWVDRRAYNGEALAPGATAFYLALWPRASVKKLREIAAWLRDNLTPGSVSVDGLHTTLNTVQELNGEMVEALNFKPKFDTMVITDESAEMAAQVWDPFVSATENLISALSEEPNVGEGDDAASIYAKWYENVRNASGELASTPVNLSTIVADDPEFGKTASAEEKKAAKAANGAATPKAAAPGQALPPGVAKPKAAKGTKKAKAKAGASDLAAFSETPEEEAIEVTE